jgi:hypothetical protein
MASLKQAVLHSYFMKVHEMRDPITKFPQRPTGIEHTRRTLAEIRAILKNPRLSPEMRHGLEQRIALLRTEIAGDAPHRARVGSPAPVSRTPPGSPEK